MTATRHHPTALIAEDEPLLAAQLQQELAQVWPELDVVAMVGDGNAAAQQALALLPQVCFLDIRMPGQTGLEAAEAIAEEWPSDRPLPLLVFVTAYDQYAVQAFEHAAVDYVLKPVQTARLARTCSVLQQRLASIEALQNPENPQQGASGIAGAVSVADLLPLLRQLSPAPAAGSGRLRVIQAAVGNQVHMVPVADVLLFEAADKYVRVITSAREYLIRTSLRELSPQLDPDLFWQVHRGTVVRADAIEQAIRDETGKVTLKMRGCAERPVVSRLHAQRFKAM